MFFLRKQLRIGTRGSRLALWQAEFVRSQLERAGFQCDISIIKTEGDRTDKPLHEFGGKGLFIKDIERSLVDKKIDIAIHSLKDMSVFEDGLFKFVVLKRDDWRDSFVSYKGGIFEIEKNARIGTTSLRRRSELYRIRDDFEFVDLRGNLDTRLLKLRKDDIDAIVVSKSGLLRLNLYDNSCMYDLESVIPSAGQGVIAIEFLDDYEFAEDIKKLEDKTTRLCVDAERGFVRYMNASCNYPIGAHAFFSEKSFCMDVMYGFTDDITKNIRYSYCSSSVLETLAQCINEITKRIKK